MGQFPAETDVDIGQPLVIGSSGPWKCVLALNYLPEYDTQRDRLKKLISDSGLSPNECYLFPLTLSIGNPNKVQNLIKFYPAFLAILVHFTDVNIVAGMGRSGVIALHLLQNSGLIKASEFEFAALNVRSKCGDVQEIPFATRTVFATPIFTTGQLKDVECRVASLAALKGAIKKQQAKDGKTVGLGTLSSFVRVQPKKAKVLVLPENVEEGPKDNEEERAALALLQRATGDLTETSVKGIIDVCHLSRTRVLELAKWLKMQHV